MGVGFDDPRPEMVRSSVTETARKMNDYLCERQATSDALFETYRSKLEIQESVAALKGRVTIYATGSYGRREATKYSDIDVFIVVKSGCAVSLEQRYQLFNDLIKINRILERKPFSKDCKYLDVHSLDNMLDLLGRPEDDSGNTFTARMLLLLEGRPLVGEFVHDEIMEAVLKRYFRDYILHSEDFIPRFLYNDITRYWKTLCLNYEAYHITGVDRARMRLDNLKLRFARKLTCFSLVIALLHAKQGVSLQQARQLIALSPLERLSRVRIAENAEHVDQALDSYADFLKLAHRSQEVDSQIEKKLANIGDLPLSHENEWVAAKAASRKFGTSLVELISAIGGAEALAQVAL